MSDTMHVLCGSLNVAVRRDHGFVELSADGHRPITLSDGVIARPRYYWELASFLRRHFGRRGFDPAPLLGALGVHPRPKKPPTEVQKLQMEGRLLSHYREIFGVPDRARGRVFKKHSAEEIRAHAAHLAHMGWVKDEA